MSNWTLDLETLRALTVAIDRGGQGQAASELGRTPSAISLQMKRLQQDIGAPLFRKDGRGLSLTEAGEIAVSYARRMLALNDELLNRVRGASLTGSVRLGCSQDFAETVLPSVLSRFAKLYPLVLVEVRIEGNTALVDAVEAGQLDLALAVGHADRPTAQLLGELQLVWIAGQEFVARSGQPLPLVLLGPKCAFRIEAIRQLDDAGIPWRVAATSASLAGLWASALGGLGITIRSGLGLPEKLLWGATIFDLPRLNRFPVTLHARSSAANECVDRLRAIVTDAATDVLAEAGSLRGSPAEVAHVGATRV